MGLLQHRRDQRRWFVEASASCRAAALGWLAGQWRALCAQGAALVALDRQAAPDRRRTALDLGVLGGLGVALIALTIWMAHWGVLKAHPLSFLLTLTGQLAFYGLASAWVIWRRPNARGALLVIVLIGLAARLVLVPQTPSASDDIYRYVWDGRIQAAGINPYRYVPSDPALAPYRDGAIYPYINRRGVPTIYPPVAQAIFRVLYAIYPDSIAWTRLAFIGVDLLTVLVLAGLLLRLGLRPERVILYAWHPLLILELGHSGHLDVVAICFLVLALRARLADRPVWTGLLLAGATLTKFYAIVALPALLWPGGLRAWRRDLQCGLVLVVGSVLAYLPFLSVGRGVFGYLSGYAREEGITSGDRFYLLGLVERVTGNWRIALPGRLAVLHPTAAQGYQVFLVAAMSGLALWCWLRPLGSERVIAGRIVLLFLALLTLATPSYPWYALLALACVPFAGPRLLLAASVMVGGAGFLYLQWWWSVPSRLPGHFVYGADLLVLLAIAARAVLRSRWPRLRPAPPAPPRPARASVTSHGGTVLAWPVQASTTAPLPVAIEEESPSLFDRFPWLYAFCREWLFRDHTARIAAALWPDGAPRTGSVLLDLGCGPGFYARRLAARFAQLRVVGIDRSAEQLRRARARALRQGVANCRFLRDDVRWLAQPAGAADAVVASRLFTILPERERALAEMHRVLRPGGRCFIAEPRSRLWTALPLRALWLLARLARLGGRERGRYREPSRATVLSVMEFEALLRTQPWAEVRHWHDRRYHYAVCRKSEDAIVAEVEAMAAD